MDKLTRSLAGLQLVWQGAGDRAERVANSETNILHDGSYDYGEEGDEDNVFDQQDAFFIWGI